MEEKKLDISRYHNTLSRKHQIIRLLWSIVWPMCTWFLPRSVGSGWKRFLLRLFGAKMGKDVLINSKIKVYYPKNLSIGENCWIGENVIIYNVAPIKIGHDCIISQYSHLCTASHNVFEKSFSLISKPIILENYVWIASDVFIGMGVTIGEGAVVGARSSVFKNIEQWNIVGGNPTKFIKIRTL